MPSEPPIPEPRSRPPTSAIVLATVAAVLAAVLVISVLGGSDDNAGESIALIPDDGEGLVPSGADPSGEAAPDLTAERLGEEGTVTLADLEGQPVVLNFFASWCAPCVAELPDLEAVHRDLGDEVTFLGVSERDDAGDSLMILEEAGVTYDAIRDPSGDALAAFGGIVMPTTVFISVDGVITSLHSGALTESDLRSTIADQLLS